MLPLGLSYGDIIIGKLSEIEMEIYDLILQYKHEKELLRASEARGLQGTDTMGSYSSKTGNRHIVSLDPLLDTLERLGQTAQESQLSDLDSCLLKLSSETSVDRARAERGRAREEAAELQRKIPLSRLWNIKTTMEAVGRQLDSLRKMLDDHEPWKYVPAASNAEIRVKIEELHPQVEELQVQMDKLALLEDTERPGGADR